MAVFVAMTIINTAFFSCQKARLVFLVRKDKRIRFILCSQCSFSEKKIESGVGGHY